MNKFPAPGEPSARKSISVWLVLLAAGGAFALTMGLFLSPLNTSTGLGVASISLLLLAVGTFITPLMTTTAGLIFAIGVVMLAHQVGGFLGAYLGGYVFQATGSYDWVWYIDIVLAAGAALVNLPIREAAPVRLTKAAA